MAQSELQYARFYLGTNNNKFSILCENHGFVLTVSTESWCEHLFSLHHF